MPTLEEWYKLKYNKEYNYYEITFQGAAILRDEYEEYKKYYEMLEGAE